MSWHPNDLVSDVDLVSYESKILTQFGQVSWQDRRVKALEDWLWPILRGQGFNPDRFRTRVAPTRVQGFTGSVFTDLTTAATNQTADDINLTLVLASASDFLFVGLDRMFRGLSIRMHDQVSSVSATLRVDAWLDNWAQLSVSDTTSVVVGRPFSAGGSLSWLVPGSWVTRPVNASADLHWVRVSLSAAPTGARIRQIGCIRRSVLAAPATYKTLEWIFREAPTGGEGPWVGKAEYYETQADLALQRAIPLLGAEFEADETVDDVIDPVEAGQTSDQVSGGPWVLERY